MRLGGESREVVAGEFWIGHGEEFLFLLCFRAEVGKAEAALRHGLGGDGRDELSGRATATRTNGIEARKFMERTLNRREFLELITLTLLGR